MFLTAVAMQARLRPTHCELRAGIVEYYAESGYRAIEKGKSLSQAARRILVSNKLLWIIISLGIFLRLVSYFHDRSLGRAEASLCLNIESRSYSELLKPLDYHQAAPLGFLILEKSALYVFGDTEYALRLVPLLAGIISLFLFYEFAKRHLTSVAIPIALGLFVIGEKLVYYSSEVKQYSSDVAVGLSLFLAAMHVQSKAMTWRRAALFGVVGAMAVWFSHPSVFILAGAGTTLLLYHLSNKSWANVIRILTAGSIWMISFAISYYTMLRNSGGSRFLVRYWSDHRAFPPVLDSVSDFGWFVGTFFKTFENPVGVSLPFLAGLVFLVGCFSLISRSKWDSLLLLSPIGYALLASGLKKYPFQDRLLLFIIPSLLVLVGEGISRVEQRSALAGIALAGVLVFQPIVNTAQNAVRQDQREDIKPALSYVREHWQDGDVLYAHYTARHLVKYYGKRYGFSQDDYIKSTRKTKDELSEFTIDLDTLRDERVWVLFLLVREKGIQAHQTFLKQLNETGARLDEFHTTGISVYLFDVSKPRLSRSSSKREDTL